MQPSDRRKASIAAKRPPSSATKRLQPLSTSRETRARKFASSKSLASASPVQTQLSIQTRAISSYSSVRAGRIVGGGMKNKSFRQARKKPPRYYREGSFHFNRARTITLRLAGPAASSAAGRFRPPWRGSCGLENLSAAIRRDRSD